MMDFELLGDKLYTASGDKDYVNDCCIGGDDILEKLGPEIAGTFGVSTSDITIYQEDWGWALEFQKDGVYYHTGVANQASDGERTIFRIVGEAQRKEKGWIFTKTVPAEEESAALAKAVVEAATNAGFEIHESETDAED